MSKKKPAFHPRFTYDDLVLQSGLADYSPVRGCMIMKPYGYALWEQMQRILDEKFKDTGHQNVYFPLFIPKSFLSREAAHVEGFAKECAVVTHYRLKNDPQKKELVVDETAKLEEELIVRPTSETVIWQTYKNWIQSYRDLPLLLNQWANVVRWEMRTRLFLRTSEFLWQEGHTAHATKNEALQESETILELYADFVENYMAIPAVRGKKTPSERFAGAEETYCIEVLLSDGKALQAGTSHFLGQNFAKAFEVTFLNKDNQREWVWATSWGVSTRLIGALIMAHADEKGLKMPPGIAPVQVVIVAIYKDKGDAVHQTVQQIAQALKNKGIRVLLDDDTAQRPGWKFAEYELKGVPVRITLGQKDLDKGIVELMRRDNCQKEYAPVATVVNRVGDLLEEISKDMLAAQRVALAQNTHIADDLDTFKEILHTKSGFIAAHWDGTPETEAHIKALTKATIRCIPLDAPEEKGFCVLTGKPSPRRVLFAQAY